MVDMGQNFKFSFKEFLDSFRVLLAILFAFGSLSFYLIFKVYVPTSEIAEAIAKVSENKEVPSMVEIEKFHDVMEKHSNFSEDWDLAIICFVIYFLLVMVCGTIFAYKLYWTRGRFVGCKFDRSEINIEMREMLKKFVGLDDICSNGPPTSEVPGHLVYLVFARLYRERAAEIFGILNSLIERVKNETRKDDQKAAKAICETMKIISKSISSIQLFCPSSLKNKNFDKVLVLHNKANDIAERFNQMWREFEKFITISPVECSRIYGEIPTKIEIIKDRVLDLHEQSDQMISDQRYEIHQKKNEIQKVTGYLHTN